ncbi:hypothetical protein [Polymorphospora rubra]|uniref:Uncharacterized protein n=1 Tax=Polymorphospora rubra TaxID=338584 RepID=A0A810N7U2_9ACTN|nr:hypothetical protein [Polymorphospora rubra]BCJ69090.1 hypothetical protein Prubr_61110 [Polymorphospora rubra]
MDENEKRIGTGYATAQLAKAFATSTGHEDAETRQRAGERLHRWESVLRGMLNGVLTIGSRTPVAGLPAWVTLEVVRGGFATGSAVAGGPLLPHETALATRTGLPAQRRALFAHHLTESGLAELTALLRAGTYRVDVPEAAALAVVAWLLGTGDRNAALALLDEIGPYADRLRFTPVPRDVPAPGPAVVWRETAADVSARLAGRRPDERIEAMREALTVWNPFADRLLALWLDTVVDGRVAVRFDDRWRDRAITLLDHYERLATVHRRCGKHRRPKENLAILRAAVQDMVDGAGLTARSRGLLQHAVDSMLRRRGRPGSPEHTALRTRQAVTGTAPTHHTFAQLVGDRVADLPPDAGIADVVAVTAPVRAGEQGAPAGAPIPEPIRRIIARGRAGTIEELVAAGVVPSAEVLAGLVPRIAAAATAAAYPDETLRALVAATHQAFGNRRSLLLRNLEHQVRFDELPWVRALAGHRHATDGTRDHADAALRRLGQLTLDAFPATLLPNPMVRQLAALGREADAGLPWVEELAADIFEGTFSGKFLAAAKIAGELLAGSLYERYYGIDYAALARIDDVDRRGRHAAATSAAFDALCLTRAGSGGWHSVAANGTVIEQAQILTTHNLATLVHVGVSPTAGWPDLARRGFATALVLTARIRHNPRPLPTIKDTAYAWRQMLFHLSMPGVDPTAAVELFWDDLDRQPPFVRDRLAPALDGLAHVVAGGGFAADGTARTGRRLLGWAVDRHWLR